jgi:hypothetical protein
VRRLRAWANRVNPLLVWSCIVLAILGAACLAAAFLLPQAMAGLSGLALNLATEILGILLTVVLIDAVIRRKEERERAWYRRIALQQLRIPLTKHLQLLSDMYKASVERKPDKEISSLGDLFSEDYFEQITYFNAMGPSPSSPPAGPSAVASGNMPPPIPWYQYLSTEVKQFKEDVERVVDKYAMHLDPETLELLEQLANSPVVFTVGHLPMTATSLQTWGHQGAYNPFMVEDDTRWVRKHTNLLLKVVDIYNKEAPDDRKILVRNIRIWTDGWAPAIGSARAHYYHREDGLRWIPPDHPTEQSEETEQSLETDQSAETEQRPE